ncbi:MAG TPA: hypothetical protein DHV85_15575, partial [Candidatus Accumulibacter sp.]|nr:hypothetical protein [Accumulibacter sp.]
MQQAVLAQRLNGSPDRAGAPGAAPDRRTAGRWWAWLQERSLLFEFRLRARQVDRGRTVDGSAFW